VLQYPWKATILEQTGNLQPARQAAKLRLQGFINLPAAFVDCGDDEILQHVSVATIENFGFDLDREEMFLPSHLHRDHPAACGRFDDRGFHLLLQLLLHLLRLLHQLLHVHTYSPFAGLTWAISPRNTSRKLL